MGFAGRLAPGKGLDVLICAIAAAREHISVRLRVAGDGPERARAESLAAAVGVADAIDFLGMVVDVAGFWHRCDLAIVPDNTWVESFCIAAVEAMACGKPVIATRLGALPEIVRDGVTGVVIPPGDAGALAAAVVRYALDSSLRSDHAVAARREVLDRFQIEACAREYVDLFATVTRDRRWRTGSRTG